MAFNQCDGCRRGLPLDGYGNHVGPGDYDFIACTAHRYETESTNDEWNAGVSPHTRIKDNGGIEGKRYCPECGSDWQGSPIPEDQQHLFGATHFHRLIGIEDPEVYDGISWWECPDCHKVWERW